MVPAPTSRRTTLFFIFDKAWATLTRSEEKMMKGAADPVAFYDQVIMAYKGQVEQWYVEHHTAKNYFLIIIATIWIILSPKSQIAWRWFPGLPKPPAELARYF